jgi:dihydrofolate reductase
VIRLIAAMDLQRGIAIDTGIPWVLPHDAAYFREKTRSGLIVMGRGTYVEFAAPLHDRSNYVLTNDKDPLRDGFTPVKSLAELHSSLPDADIWVIGGAFVYSHTIGQADELLVTQVFSDFHCTKFFPPYEELFTLMDASDEQREGAVTYRFETWVRNLANG